MQKIPLKLAKPGMVLAKPVARDNGMVLLAQGTELAESTIQRLENMNVERIVIEGEVDLGDGAGTNYDTLLANLDRLFRKHTGDKWMMKLKEALRAYFTLKAAAAKAPAPEPEDENDGEEAAE